MSMSACAKCGDVYDTDFQMEVDEAGNCICDKCFEKATFDNSDDCQILGRD